MILTRTCPLCGWNNDNNSGPCHKCEGQTEQRKVARGRWQTVIVKQPKIAMTSYYDPDIKSE